MLSLDDLLAAYWPEYVQRGEEGITVRHVLQHRAGVPVAGSLHKVRTGCRICSQPMFVNSGAYS
jgi:CubicO group peptidase (beta-lactamase class C family)